MISKLKRKRNFLILIPVIFGFFQVAYYGVNVVYWDEWELVRLFDSIQNSGLTFSQLFAQHNEHRIFFPRIVMLLSGVLTQWNVKVNMYISQVMVSLMYLSYLFYFKNNAEGCIISDEKKNGWIRIAFAIAVGICCFSAVQWQNFLWGFQVGFIMVAFGSACSFYYFYRGCISGNGKYYVYSWSFGIIASFSSLQGLLIWPVYLIAILMLVIFYKKINKAFVGTFVVGFFSIILYLKGYSSVGGHPSLFGDGIIDLLKYFIVAIGNIGCSLNKYTAFTFGCVEIAVALLMVIYVIRKKKLKENIFSLCLMLYGYMVIGAIAVGRAGFGIDQALASRYTTFALFTLIGVLMICYDFYINEKPTLYRKAKLGIVCILVLCVAANSICAIFLKYNEERLFRERLAGILRDYEQNSFEELRWIYPWGDYADAYDTIEILEDNQINVFAKKDYSYGKISADRLNGLTEVALPRQIGFDKNSIMWDDKFICMPEAWAVDFISEKEYRNVFVRVNGSLFRTSNHIKRQDVSDYFDNEHFSNAGFIFSHRIDELQYGENLISVVILLNDGKSFYETERVTLYKDESGNVSNFNMPEIDKLLSSAKSTELKQLISTYQVKDLINEGSKISFTTESGGDSQIVFEQLQGAVSPKLIKITFSALDERETFQLFYSKEGEAFFEQNSCAFSVNPDQMIYLLEPRNAVDIKNFRLDFGGQDNKHIEIDSIVVYE